MPRFSELRTIRQSEGLTQPQLAVAAGVSVRTLERAENTTDIKTVTANKILIGLNALARENKYSLADLEGHEHIYKPPTTSKYKNGE